MPVFHRQTQFNSFRPKLVPLSHATSSLIFSASRTTDASSVWLRDISKSVSSPLIRCSRYGCAGTLLEVSITFFPAHIRETSRPANPGRVAWCWRLRIWLVGLPLSFRFVSVAGIPLTRARRGQLRPRKFSSGGLKPCRHNALSISLRIILRNIA
jgi:hypothetical protein